MTQERKGFERRRHRRYPYRVRVTLSKGGQEAQAYSEDVSLSGLFVRMEMPVQERWLVRLRLTLPPGNQELSVMGMAARQCPGRDGVLPGVGIQLYSLAPPDRKRWEAFIEWVSSRPVEAAAAPAEGPPKPVERLHLRYAAVLQVKLQTVSDLVLLFTQNVSKGGLFVGTTLDLPEGTSLKVSVIHPNTGEQFELEAEVRWRNTATDPGLGLEFVRLSEQRRNQFVEFIRSEIPVEQLLYRSEGDGRLALVSPPEGTAAAPEAAPAAAPQEADRPAGSAVEAASSDLR
jgi:uncharacterized protein (TIGR02266 family)